MQLLASPPPVYLPLAGAGMPTSQRPNSDFENKILEGFGELRGAMRAVETQLKQVTERADRGSESSAANTEALKQQDRRMERLENLNSSNAQSSLNGYRELSSALNALKDQVDKLTEAAKDAAPAVADDVAGRIRNKDAKFRKYALIGIGATGSTGTLAAVAAWTNFFTSHPHILPSVFSGLKRAVDAAVG